MKIIYLSIIAMLFLACYPKVTYSLWIKDEYFRFWMNIRLQQKNKVLEPGFALIEGERYDSFTNLTKGDYSILFISRFNDTVRQEVTINSNTFRTFPKSLRTYYDTLLVGDIQTSLKFGDSFFTSFEVCSFAWHQGISEYIYWDTDIVAKVFPKEESIQKFYIPDFKSNLIDYLTKADNTSRYGICSGEVIMFKGKIMSYQPKPDWPEFKRLEGLKSPVLKDTTMIDRLKQRFPF